MNEGETFQADKMICRLSSTEKCIVYSGNNVKSGWNFIVWNEGKKVDIRGIYNQRPSLILICIHVE